VTRTILYIVKNRKRCAEDLFRPAKLRMLCSMNRRRKYLAMCDTPEMQDMQNGNKQIDGRDGAVRCNWTVAAEAKSLMFIGVRPLGDARGVAPTVNTRFSHRGPTQGSRFNQNHPCACACQGSPPPDARHACVASEHRCERRSSPLRRARSGLSACGHCE